MGRRQTLQLKEKVTLNGSKTLDDDHPLKNVTFEKPQEPKQGDANYHPAYKNRKVSGRHNFAKNFLFKIRPSFSKKLIEKAEAEQEAKINGTLPIDNNGAVSPQSVQAQAMAIDPSIPKPPVGKKRFIDYMQGISTPAARRKSVADTKPSSSLINDLAQFHSNLSQINQESDEDDSDESVLTPIPPQDEEPKQLNIKDALAKLFKLKSATSPKSQV